MKNYLSSGNSNDFIAPVGGVVNGELVSIGGLVVVPMTDADAGETFTGFLTGKYTFAKADDFEADVGDNAYWNSTTGEIEGTDSGTNRRVGIFLAAAGETDTTCEVRLDAISLGSGGDLEAKADKVVPETPGNIATLNAAGNLTDGGPLVAELPDYSEETEGKVLSLVSGSGGIEVSWEETAAAGMELVTGSTEDHFASFDAAGQVKDSGYSNSTYAAASHQHQVTDIQNFPSLYQTVATVASAYLELDSLPTDGDTVVIGAKTFEFDDDALVEVGNIPVTIVALDLPTTKANLITAINSEFGTLISMAAYDGLMLVSSTVQDVALSASVAQWDTDNVEGSGNPAGYCYVMPIDISAAMVSTGDVTRYVRLKNQGETDGDFLITSVALYDTDGVAKPVTGITPLIEIETINAIDRIMLNVDFGSAVADGDLVIVTFIGPMA